MYQQPYNVAPFIEYTNGSATGQFPAPWDKTFQARWNLFAQAIAGRYGSDPNLAYVTFSGLGHSIESFLATNNLETQEAYAGGYSATWEIAGKNIIDMWAQAWSSTAVCLATGVGVQTDNSAMTNIAQHGISTYTHKIPVGRPWGAQQFALKCCGLSSTFPNTSTFAHTAIPISPNLNNTYIVYQMVGTVQSGRLGVGGLQGALNQGIAQGGNAIEVYTEDCNAAPNQTMIQQANSTLLSYWP